MDNLKNVSGNEEPQKKSNEKPKEKLSAKAVTDEVINHQTEENDSNCQKQEVYKHKEDLGIDEPDKGESKESSQKGEANSAFLKAPTATEADDAENLTENKTLAQKGGQACGGNMAVDENQIQADAGKISLADEADSAFVSEGEQMVDDHTPKACENSKGFLARTAGKVNKKILTLGGIILLAATIWGLVSFADYWMHGEKSYAITVNKLTVAVVENQRTAKKVINDYLTGGYTGAEITDAYYIDDVEAIKVHGFEDDAISDYQTAMAELARYARTSAPCVSIMADGKEVVKLPCEETADSALEMLKTNYTPDDPTLVVKEVKFREQVEILEATADVKDIYGVESAVKLMGEKTTREDYTYTVKADDTLESICKTEGIAVSAIVKGSKDVDFEALKVGDPLIIGKEEKAINVLTELEKTKDEIISYQISYQENHEMPAGTRNVVQEGFDGEETVTLKIIRMNGEELYRERTYSQVNIEPITKVIDCGTKVFKPTGSTGYAAAGSVTSINQMIWPTNATAISSLYGIRSSGFHTGLDINGEMGDPIFAALDGTVVSAGWAGNYGNCIVLDHGNGLKTRYAHLSAIGVGMGQAVRQGQTIGLEGSTGNSTGAHLHFEILINGSSVDPLLYISR